MTGAEWLGPERSVGRPLNLTGHRYGRLTVTDQHRSGTKKHPGRTWLCRCDCGGEKWVPGWWMRRHGGWTVNGNKKPSPVQSCGCLEIENRRKNGLASTNSSRKPEGVAARRSLWNLYKRKAVDRGLEWGVPYEEFARLTLQPCHYCGAEPAQRSKGNKYTFNGSCTYNGLDRQDNAQGYTLENVVPCCGTCNMAKRALSVKDFLAHISRIYLHQEALHAARA